MKNKGLNLIVGLLMLVALGGALLLVKQNQNTEKGAYFAGTKLLMQPSDAKGTVGGDVLIQLFAETEKISADYSEAGDGGLGQGAGDSCGTKPAEQCAINANEGSMLRVRPVCINGSWDYDDQLCTAKGRTDMCGGKDYCCPSKGGKWTTDMTECTEPEVGGYAKISSIDTIVCYGPNLKITDPDTQVVLNEEALKTKVDVSLVTVEGKSCLRLIAISDVSAKPEDLKGGMVKIATLKFKGESGGTGKVEYVVGQTKVGGYNPYKRASDTALKVGSATGTTYDISGAGVVDCNLKVNPPEKCPAGYFCLEKNISGPTPPGYRDGDGTCVEGCASDSDCPSGQVCDEHVCKAQSGDTPILNFQVSYGNVKVSDGKCVVDWPMQVIVLAKGESKVYTGVKPILMGTSGDKIIYQGRLPLTGFNHFENVAAFIKGPKHLQMKYAVQNQSAPYDKAGGQLTLTKDATTSPLYNFSAYPIIPGDVKGPNSENPDGWIDGVDFAYVKGRSLTHETVAESGYLKADLDGNCQVNSNDVNVLKISLQTKQGQLY